MRFGSMKGSTVRERPQYASIDSACRPHKKYLRKQVFFICVKFAY